MKHQLQRILAVLLAAALLCGALPLFACAASAPAAAESKHTACGADCPYYPTIIVPGLGQSSVIVVNDDGSPKLDKDGNKTAAFPAYIQTGKLIRRVIGPALLSLLSQRDLGLSDAVADAIYDAFSINACDEHAQTIGKIKTEKYPYPYAEYSAEDKAAVNMHVPFEKYPTELPADHLYYFAYNSFGNHIDLAAELYEFIQMVKAQTGHSKVNLVPLSQGASIFSAMLDYYPAVADDLHKLMLVVPALDGSMIIGDVFNDRITFLNADYLYHGFLEDMRLLDEYTAHLIEVLVRILPDEIVIDSLKKGVKRLVGEIMTRSTGMWALCPSGDYESAAQKYLSAPELADIRRQTDRYYQAQLHSRDNVAALQQKGVQVFCVAEYNIPLIDVGERWNQQNADFIIQLDSTSLGATAANCGETLPADYQQQNTHCSDPTHNHISPNRVVDASTGLLADTTFYYSEQRHDLTQHNNSILMLAMQLIANDNIKDVYSDPRFPQFNVGRDVRVVETPLEAAKAVDAGTLSAADAAELAAAIEQAETLLANPACGEGDFDAAAARLNAILVKIGAQKAEKEKDPAFLRKLSDWLYQNFGSNGFSEIPKAALQKLFQSIFSR